MKILSLSLALSGVLAAAHPGTLLHGQLLHAKGPLPSYEVATIKPLHSFGELPGINRRPDLVVYVGSIKQLIGLAYNLPPLSTAQIADAPAWTAQEQYVVEGKIDDATFARLQHMTEQQAQEEREFLLQSLLAQRLNLKLHYEMREYPMYAMLAAKGGIKLQPSREIPDATDTVLPPPIEPGTTPTLAHVRKGFFAMPQGTDFKLQAKGLTLDELAQMLQRQPDAEGRLITNRTGIAGFYDCSMKWARDTAAETAGGTAGLPPSSEPVFFTAIREQLGLRLVPTKGQAETIVIDSIERPSEN